MEVWTRWANTWGCGSWPTSPRTEERRVEAWRAFPPIPRASGESCLSARTESGGLFGWASADQDGPDDQGPRGGPGGGGTRRAMPRPRNVGMGGRAGKACYTTSWRRSGWCRHGNRGPRPKPSRWATFLDQYIDGRTDVKPGTRDQSASRPGEKLVDTSAQIEAPWRHHPRRRRPYPAGPDEPVGREHGPAALRPGQAILPGGRPQAADSREPLCAI